MNKEMYIDNNNYTVWLQYVEDKVAVHITVHNWNKSVYRELIHSVADFEDFLINKGYKEVYGVLPETTEEFAYMFNWQYVGKNGVTSIFKKELGHG